MSSKVSRLPAIIRLVIALALFGAMLAIAFYAPDWILIPVLWYVIGCVIARVRPWAPWKDA